MSETKIGEGMSCSVFKSVNERSGKISALKKVKFKPEPGYFNEIDYLTVFVDQDAKVREDDVDNEVFILKKLQLHPHPNIATFHCCWKVGNCAVLSFDYYPVDLHSLINSHRKKYDKSMIKKWMYQLLSAIRFCHSEEIIHRDVKPQNIMIDARQELKLCDFGSAISFHNEYYDFFDLCIGNTHNVQTLWYRAPEIMLGINRYSFCIDIWSIGCVMFELLTEKTLFPGSSEIGQLYKIFEILGTPNEESWPGVSDLSCFRSFFCKREKKDLGEEYDIDHDELDLLEKLLVYHPEKRITAKNAMEHYWFDVQEVDFECDDFECDEDSLDYNRSFIFRKRFKKNTRKYSKLGKKIPRRVF
jgi:serine/threonine protein kinase